MSETWYLTCAIALMALTMFGLRAFPFVLFRGGEKTPEPVRYFGERMTPAAIAMLIVYCMNGVRFTVWPSALPEAIALAGVVAAQLVFRNALLSVFGGTLLYMGLVQFVF